MKEYNNTLRHILENGQKRMDRTGVGTIGVFGCQMRFDLRKGFPAITTKKLAWRSVLSEAIWFLEGSGDEGRLKEILHGSRDSVKKTIWSENANAPYWKPKAKFEGDLGRVYGVNWRSWEATQYFDKENILQAEYLDYKDLNFACPPSYEIISGVGVLDNTEIADEFWVEVAKKEWQGLIHKMYGKNNGETHFCKDWLIFKNFARDFKKIPNWELKLEYPDLYVLSCKINATNRHSLSSSVFISLEEEINNRHSTYIRPDGKNIIVKKRKYDQIKKLIATIRHDPNSRRLLLSSFNVGELEQMALPPCHTLAQFFVQDTTLSCQLYQRSADMFLGVPFNIASYALITHVIAQICDLNVGELIHTLGDAHIYQNHVEQVNLLLTREEYDLPKLKINRKVNVDDIRMEDFELIDYKHHESIAAHMAV